MQQKLTFAFLGMVLALCYATSAGVLAADLTDARQLESFFDGVMAVQLRQYASPGAMVAVVKDGEILLAKGYGWADKEERVPVDPVTTMFRPGSNSKLFVWTAVMQLVEQGLLDLDTDINEYLDFAMPDTLLDGRPAGPITMRHLMTHTAGFEDVMAEVFVERMSQLLPLGEYLRDIPARVFPAGSISVYSNYGSSLAGYIVERISGQTFDAYVDEHIFAPLGMNYSTFTQPLPAHLRPYMAKGYLYRGGEAEAADFEWLLSYPAGGLASSVQDMAVFMLAHLSGGTYNEGQILEADTAAYMHRQHFSNHPSIPGMTLGFIEGQRNDVRYLAHGGDTLQMHTGLWLFPEENLGIYVSYNGAATVMARVVLFEEFMDRYFPVERPLLDPVPDMEKLAQPLLGSYQAARSNFSGQETILRLLQSAPVALDDDGFLTTFVMGRPRQFVPIEPDLWSSRDGRFRLAAAFDDEGMAEYLFTGDPMPLMRAPWYGTLQFLGPLVIGGVLWFLLFLIHWLRRLFKHSGRAEYLERWPLWLPMWFFSLLTMALVAFGVVLVFRNSPTYGMPLMFFDWPTSTFRIMAVISGAMAVFALWQLIFSLRSWVRGGRRLRDKVYYTLSAFWSCGLVWFLYYSNFFTW